MKRSQLFIGVSLWLALLLQTPAYLFPLPALAQHDARNFILATVVKVQDGDTVEVVTDDGRSLRVQLAYIDAPDEDARSGQKQPFHDQSKALLEKLTLNKEVVVDSVGTDPWGRVEGMVFVGKLNVNVKMIRRGMAEIYHPVRAKPFNYKKFYSDQMFRAEKTAKEEKAGIWGDPDYISPYKWRRRGR